MSDESIDYEIIEKIEKDVAQTLSADLSVCCMAISDDYENTMATELATTGMFVLVSIPDASFREVQSPRVILDPIKVAVTVTVTRGTNKPSISASGLALKCAQCLVMRTPSGCNRPLVFSGNSELSKKHNSSTDSATVILTTSTAFPATF